MRTTVFLTLAVLSGFVIPYACSAGVAAPVPKHLMKEAENTEQSKLQGKWKLESTGIGGLPVRGNPNGPNGGLDITLEFRGDKLTATGPQPTLVSKIKLDTIEGVKRCTTFDALQLGQDGKPDEKKDGEAFGYIVDGNKLTIAVRLDATGGKANTAADPSKPNTDTILMVFTRVKDKN
jgi:uncharacterized protein (TIGR03067 family)